MSTFGAVTPIGIATSAGDIQVGQVRMPGSATLYEGAVVETVASPAQLNLRNGALIHLGAGARATIHAGAFQLERGVGQVEAPADYQIRAGSMTFVPNSRRGRARLQVMGNGAVQVAALSGSFDVHRLGVASVGKVTEGMALSFAPDAGPAGATAPAQFKGCLAKSNKGYLLQEETSRSVLALAGTQITAKSGDRVTVVGKPDLTATPVAGTSEVIQILRLTVDGHGCSSKEVIAAAGAGAKAAGTIAGMSTTTVAVIGAAATSAALIPTIALTTGSNSSSSSISASSR